MFIFLKQIFDFTFLQSNKKLNYIQRINEYVTTLFYVIKVYIYVFYGSYNLIPTHFINAFNCIIFDNNFFTFQFFNFFH